MRRELTCPQLNGSSQLAIDDDFASGQPERGQYIQLVILKPLMRQAAQKFRHRKDVAMTFNNWEYGVQHCRGF